MQLREMLFPDLNYNPHSMYMWKNQAIMHPLFEFLIMNKCPTRLTSNMARTTKPHNTCRRHPKNAKYFFPKNNAMLAVPFLVFSFLQVTCFLLYKQLAEKRTTKMCQVSDGVENKRRLKSRFDAKRRYFLKALKDAIAPKNAVLNNSKNRFLVL